MTAINRNSKPDTVLLLTDDADLWVDISQSRTDLTDDGTYLSEASSARTALDAPREVSVVVQAQSGESGVLVQHSNAGSYGYRLRISGGEVQCHEAGALRVSVTIPDLTGSDRRIVIQWSQRPEGSDVRSELTVCNDSTGAWAHASATHAASSPDPADKLTIGAAHTGGSAWSGGLGSIEAVRIGRRHHSGAEAREDWVAERTQPTVTQVRRRPALVPDRATLELAGDGDLVGPAHLVAGHTFEHADRRLLSPLLNLRVRDPDGLDNTHSPESWWRKAPGEAYYYIPINYLFYRAVPEKCNRAYVRIFVSQSATGEPATAPLRYKVFSMAGVPVLNEGFPPLKYTRTAAVTSTAVHASGEGEWLDLGAMGLQVDDWGMTWIGVALNVDDDSGSALADLSVTRIRAVTVEPFFEPIKGGLDKADP